MIDVEGEDMRALTWVRINKFESGNWATGGKALLSGEAQALIAENNELSLGDDQGG
jgi:4-oxalocrotonate tautomerase